MGAHFDFRDPHMTEYPMMHGSPLFFLLRRQLKDAIQEWENLTEEERNYTENVKKKEAITFLKASTEGRKYWDTLKPRIEEQEREDVSHEHYRGFNWLNES